MKILVTGCAGFIGFHLCNNLVNKHIRIFGIDNLNDFVTFYKKIAFVYLKKNKNFNSTKKIFQIIKQLKKYSQKINLI